ncbi:hypothetical protein CLIB1444_05S02916 [[Candida] jaroonii]|uniref:Uncharacterized protein n=1 Tax=[Candida] jaroonii TaxID=467808 RepID=A0ACA9Y7S5_9ASCO|nr:hypothetical protein CLIB1444_05S02916 [[Candida] jaroonii]
MDETDKQVEDSTELSKEERLELAKKKYEELKKKKKKKKSKDKKKEDTEEKESTQEPEEVNNDKDQEDIEETKPEESTVLEGEQKEVKDEAVEGDKEVIEEAETEAEAEKEIKEPVKEETIESTEPEESIKIETTVEEVKTSNPQTSGIQTESQSIEELKELIAVQEKTIKRLRDENTDLKLQKMDLLDKIKTLEVSSSTAASPQSPIKHIPAKPVYVKNDYSEENNEVNEVTDFRERLLVWKNWQVNMTDWSSTYLTEKVTM